MAWTAGPTLMLMIALAVAGCAEPAPALRAGSSAPPPQATIDQQAGDGSLEGYVIDDEQRPLERVKVAGVHRGADNVTFEVETDAAGHFLVTGLMPGPYTLQAARLGYHTPAAKVVDVLAGETAEVRFTLTPMPVLEPFHQTKTYTFHWNEELGLILPAPVGYFGIITGWQSQNVTMPIEINEEEQGPLAAIVVEMKWTPPVTYCAGAFRSDVYSPEQTGLDPTFPPINSQYWGDENPFHWDNVPERTASPTHLFIPREGDNVSAMHSAQRTELNGGTPIETEGKWIVEVQSAAEYARGAFGTPVDVACTYDTTVTSYVSTFHMLTPDWTWSVFDNP